MRLRESATVTPAKLEANRRNARKSTGPRTTAGKLRSRLNRLRHARRSAIYRDLLVQIMDAPPGELQEVAAGLFTPALLERPAIASLARLFGINKEAERPAELRDGGELDKAPAHGARRNRRMQAARARIRGADNPFWPPLPATLATKNEIEENDDRSQKVLQNRRFAGQVPRYY